MHASVCPLMNPVTKQEPNKPPSRTDQPGPRLWTFRLTSPMGYPNRVTKHKSFGHLSVLDLLHRIGRAQILRSLGTADTADTTRHQLQTNYLKYFFLKLFANDYVHIASLFALTMIIAHNFLWQFVFHCMRPCS